MRASDAINLMTIFSSMPSALHHHHDSWRDFRTWLRRSAGRFLTNNRVLVRLLAVLSDYSDACQSLSWNDIFRWFSQRLISTRLLRKLWKNLLSADILRIILWSHCELLGVIFFLKKLVWIFLKIYFLKRNIYIVPSLIYTERFSFECMLIRKEDLDNKLHSGKHAYCFHDVILLKTSLLTVTLTQYAHRNSVMQCHQLCQEGYDANWCREGYVPQCRLLSTICVNVNLHQCRRWHAFSSKRRV